MIKIINSTPAPSRFPSSGRSLCSAANKETPCGPSHLNFRLLLTCTPLVPQKRREAFGLARKIHDNKKRLPRPSSPEMRKIEEWERKYWILIPYCFNTPGKSASYLRSGGIFSGGCSFPFDDFNIRAQFSRFLIRFPVRYERVFIYTRAYFNPLMLRVLRIKLAVKKRQSIPSTCRFLLSAHRLFDEYCAFCNFGNATTVSSRLFNPLYILYIKHKTNIQ